MADGTVNQTWKKKEKKIIKNLINKNVVVGLLRAS